MTATTLASPTLQAGSSTLAGPAPGAGRLRTAVTIRTVQVALGALWLLDGLLQLQPKMFSSSFVSDVLAPAAQGQPSWLRWLIDGNSHMIGTHVAAWNALFATVQILIGIGMLLPGTLRPALAAGAAWSVGVWVLGEGLGMVPAGTASPLMGAPGAVLLYGVVGLMAWPAPARWLRWDQRRDGHRLSAASAGVIGDRGGRVAWAVLWCSSALLWLLPANTAHGAIGRQLAGMSDGEPGWLAHLDHLAARATVSSGVTDALALALISAVIGLGPLVSRRPAAYLAAGAILSLAFWVFGQDFGGILTAPSGTATDPNAGPLFVLMAAALMPGRGAPYSTWGRLRAAV